MDTSVTWSNYKSCNGNEVAVSSRVSVRFAEHHYIYSL
jgi:hypothetical protein